MTIEYPFKTITHPLHTVLPLQEQIEEKMVSRLIKEIDAQLWLPIWLQMEEELNDIHEQTQEQDLN